MCQNFGFQVKNFQKLSKKKWLKIKLNWLQAKKKNVSKIGLKNQ